MVLEKFARNIVEAQDFHRSVAGTGPRATVKRTVFVSRCSSGSPDPDLFVIWRAQTTEGGSSGVHPNDRGGQAPALRCSARPFYRRARACPSPCQSPGAEFARQEQDFHDLQDLQDVEAAPFCRARAPALARSGSGDPELQMGGRTIAGDRPPRYGNLGVFIVGRGPVPRHAAFAGDRPPRYGNLGVFIVGRGPVPRHATIAGDRPPRYGDFKRSRRKPLPRLL